MSTVAVEREPDTDENRKQRGFIRQVLFVFGILGLGASALSVANLTQHVWQFGWEEPLRTFFENYNWVLAETLGRLEPLIDALLASFAHDLQLINPTWRDLMVIYSVVLSGMYRGIWSPALADRIVVVLCSTSLTGLVILNGTVEPSFYNSNVQLLWMFALAFLGAVCMALLPYEPTRTIGRWTLACFAGGALFALANVGLSLAN